MKTPVERFGVIADDLTGAMDAGAGFARMGLDTIVIFGDRPVPEATVVVVSTDSRVAAPLTAYQKVKKEAHKLAGLYVYKKIDSTLRGNIGQELRAVMDALGTEKAIVSPAFPGNKRSVVGSRLLVDNVPVDKTSFAEDPVSPVTEAHIPTLLYKQGGFEVESIDLDDVEKGPSHISRQIFNNKHRVIVIDAVEQVHLKYIAEALAMGSSSWLPCGSAGLAIELPLAFGYKQRETEPVEPMVSGKPVLIVAGSRHEATVRQIKMAEARLDLSLISVESGEFVHRQGRLARQGQLVKEVGKFLNCGRNVIITSAFSQYMPVLKGTVARILAEIAVGAVRQWEVAGLILTGGDVARETCEALNVNGIRILRELEPGVIAGEMMGGIKEGLKVITKAGGFGSDEAIVDAICYLGRNKRWNRKASPCSA